MSSPNTKIVFWAFSADDSPSEFAILAASTKHAPFDMNTPPKPVKEAVALAISTYSQTGMILTVQRPHEPGEELPGVWGLPAASVRAGERHAEAAIRAGRDKLGVELELQDAVGFGEQERGSYLLSMTVYRADLVQGETGLELGGSNDGTTQYTGWRWASPEALQPAADLGSLCSQLYLRWLKA